MTRTLPEEADDPRLWRLYQELELDPHVRAEFIEGTILISGLQSLWHGQVVTWIIDHLAVPCQNHGWSRDANGALQLPPPARAIRPDLLVYNAQSLPHLEADIPPSQVFLVVEVVSEESGEADRILKPLSCAQAGIPLYLYVDPLVTPMTVNLLSEPEPTGYRCRDEVAAIAGGGELVIPEPFGFTLDLGSLPAVPG